MPRQPETLKGEFIYLSKDSVHQTSPVRGFKPTPILPPPTPHPYKPTPILPPPTPHPYKPTPIPTAPPSPTSLLSISPPPLPPFKNTQQTKANKLRVTTSLDVQYLFLGVQRYHRAPSLPGDGTKEKTAGYYSP